MTLRLLRQPLKTSFHLGLSLAVAMSFTAPQPAQARDAAAKAIMGAIVLGGVYCATHPDKCGGTARAGSRGGGGGPVDAIALSREEAMWIQGGLQNLGFYRGAIDGAFGSGSRAAVRAYQAAIGEAQTGVLTAKQINDLVALSPTFANYSANDRTLFNADRASDLDRDGVRQLQAALNARGFSAGPVDGAFGTGSRNAVASYKAANGLPGKPVASRRLLAHLMGWAPPEPAGLYLASARPPAQAAPATRQPAPLPTATPAPGTNNTVLPTSRVPAALGGYDILGVRLGMTEAQVKSTLMGALGGSLMVDSADAATLGASGPVTSGFLATQPGWPTAPSEQVMALFDAARPDMGALAVIRMIRMPDTVDRTVFETQVLPDIIDNYGGGNMVPDANRWVTNANAPGMTASAAACGDMRVMVDTGAANALDALWRSGGGPRFAGDGPGSVAADCGEVLDVSFADGVVQIGLWNASALSGAAAAPKIKF